MAPSHLAGPGALPELAGLHGKDGDSSDANNPLQQFIKWLTAAISQIDEIIHSRQEMTNCYEFLYRLNDFVSSISDVNRELEMFLAVLRDRAGLTFDPVIKIY